MSRNFELMHQVGLDPGAATLHQESRGFSAAYEKASQNAARLDLLEMGREEILRLVQRIFLLPTKNGARAVLFASVNQGNGCSQVCLLVAEALKANGSGSVCLVEANFRSPSLPSLLGAANHRGLTDALQQEGPIRSFARPLLNGDVWLLPSGVPTLDSPNLLNSERMRARFEDLRKEFDYIVVDAPPLNPYADATALGRITDGLVLVLEANETRKESALRVMDNLRAAQIQVLGAVLNKRTFPIPEALYHRL